MRWLQCAKGLLLLAIFASSINTVAYARGGQTPSGNAVNRFREILVAGGINVKFRQRKGDDINAACGQLRRGTPALAQIG